MASSYFIHGNAVTVAEQPGDLENVGGIGWTDIVGLRQGHGTTFRGKGGKFVWFHLPFPTPLVVNDVQSDMARLEVLFDVNGDCSVDSIHLWGNRNDRWFWLNDLGLTSSWGEDFPPGSILRGVLSISVGVNFRQPSNITFRGVALTLR